MSNWDNFDLNSYPEEESDVEVEYTLPKYENLRPTNSGGYVKDYDDWLDYRNKLYDRTPNQKFKLIDPENEIEYVGSITNDTTGTKLFIKNEVTKEKGEGAANCAMITFYQFVKCCRMNFDTFYYDYFQMNMELHNFEYSEDIIKYVKPLWDEIYNGAMGSWHMLAHHIHDNFFESKINDEVSINDLYTIINKFLHYVILCTTGFERSKSNFDLDTNQKLKNQRMFNDYIKFMSEKTNTIPFICLSSSIESVKKFDKTNDRDVQKLRKFKHIYLTVYDIEEDLLMNFNSNYQAEKVCLDNRKFFSISFYTRDINLKAYNGYYIDPKALTVSTQSMNLGTNYDEINTYYPWIDTGNEFYIYNRSHAYAVYLFFESIGNAYYVDLFDNMEGLNDITLNDIDNVKNAMNSLLEKYPEVVTWPEYIYRYEESYDINNLKYYATKGFNEIEEIIEFLFKAMYGIDYKSIIPNVNNLTESQVKSFEQAFNEYTKYMSSRLKVVPALFVVLNEGSTDDIFTYRYDKIFIDFMVFQCSNKKAYEFRIHRANIKLDQNMPVFEIEKFSPFNSIEFPEDQHIDSLPQFIIDRDILPPLTEPWKDDQLPENYSYHIESLKKGVQKFDEDRLNNWY